MTDLLSLRAHVLLQKAEEMRQELPGKDCVLTACNVALRAIERDIYPPQFVDKSQPKEPS